MEERNNDLAVTVTRNRSVVLSQFLMVIHFVPIVCLLAGIRLLLWAVQLGADGGTGDRRLVLANQTEAHVP